MANLIIVCGPKAVDKMTVADIVIETFQLVANEKDEKEYRFGV